MVDRPQACPEWQEDLAAWLVAQGTPAREAALLDHLAGCDACRAEADGLMTVAAVALVADPERTPAPAPGTAADQHEPPVDLGPRIAARVAAERRGRMWRRVVVAAVGGAAAAAVAIGAVVMAGDAGTKRIDGEHFAFTKVPEGSTAQVVVAPYEGDASQVQLVATGLDPDTIYALWLAVPGGGRDERVPAGTFRPDEHGKVDILLQCGMPAAEVGRVWATTPANELALDTLVE